MLAPFHDSDTWASDVVAALDGVAQRGGHVIDGELVARRRRQVVPVGGDRARFAVAERGEQGGDRRLRLAGDKDVDRRQALIVHAPAVVQVMVDARPGSPWPRLSPAALEGAGGIEPVEAEDHVGVRGSPPRPPPPVRSCSARRHASHGRSGKLPPTFRSVTTCAPSRSASVTRAFQHSSEREQRPARISGRLASRSNAAA